MNALGRKEIKIWFPWYIEESTRLFAELEAIPDWRMFKYNRKLREVGRLNNWYYEKMQEWELA